MDRSTAVECAAALIIGAMTVLALGGGAAMPRVEAAASSGQNVPADLPASVAADEHSLPAPPASVAEPTGDAVATPDAQELLQPRDQDWLLFNHDYRSQRFSRLDQITAANAAKLAPVCRLALGTSGSFEAGPIVYHGVAYVSTPRTVEAFAADTCERRWTSTYTPSGPEAQPTNRGVALYAGRLFRGTTDGHLLALDAASGKPLWDVHVADSRAGFFLSAAPIVVDGRVIIGLAGADWGADGRLYAFDARTGAALWAFDFIPRGGELGADTWGGGTGHGGGSSWSSVSVDPDQHLVYAPVGNPAPDFDLVPRPGANLFTDSVVAIDIDTGKLAWYVQQNAADVHDWDTTAAPVLYEQAGRRYLAVVSKDGWLYLYDRATHALLSKSAVSQHFSADVPVGIEPLHVCPGIAGGVEWNGPAYDPRLGALYVGSVDWCGFFSRKPTGYVQGHRYFGGQFTPDPPASARGWVRAFDAASGRQLWAYHDPSPVDGGVTATAGGLVFTGDQDGWFLALDARTGRLRYRFQTGGAIGGGVVTYAVNGRQYVMVASGNASDSMARPGGAAGVLVFALPSDRPPGRSDTIGQ